MSCLELARIFTTWLALGGAPRSRRTRFKPDPNILAPSTDPTRKPTGLASPG